MSNLIDVVIPADAQEGTKAILAQWLKQPGDHVTEHEPILELETDKVTQEVSAPAAGILVEVLKQQGEEIEPEVVLGRIKVNGKVIEDEPPVQQQTTAQTTKPDVVTRADKQSPISPAVRRLLREHELDITQIIGTGKNGRVTKQDVMAYMEQGNKTITKQPEQTKTPADITGDSRMVPHSAMRKRIAEHMVTSLLHTAPHVTSVFEADMSAVIVHRNANKASFKAQGVNLTFTAYFVSAVTQALAVVPEANSRFHDDALEIFTDMNIGVGTALEDKGLVVPVIQQAQTKNLFGIAKELQTLTQKAKQGKLDRSDVQNGTFTISNHGVSGSLFATPIIINQPQSAILGLGKLEKRVIVREVDGQDTIQIRPMLYVSLTIDHRVLDGYQTNLFLSTFVKIIETWQ